MPLVQIPLCGGARGVAHVSILDIRLAQRSWYSAKRGGYVMNRALGPLHRLVLGLQTGDSRHVDHINGNRLDNRRANLRVVTQAQNNQNTAARRGTSAHRGVCWASREKRWVAYARIDGVQHNLGAYDSELEAARRAAAFRAQHMPFTNEARHAV